MKLRHHSVLPGFGLTMGFTLLYLCLIVLIPLGTMLLRSTAMTWAEFRDTLLDPPVMAAFRLTLWASLIAATANAVFGFVVAWVLVRYPFPAKRFVDALVDLPFALPTAVSGIALTSLYKPPRGEEAGGWIGQWLAPLGIQVAYTQLGVIVALTFIGLPFVVRTLQPALEDLDTEVEEAAASLGAGRLQTFGRVILPTVLPALLTGFALALARGLGEYGSVIFVANNLPMQTEIAPLKIVQKLDQHNYAGATAIGVVMLAASFLLLLTINLLQWWSRRHAET
jgi:sulfate transport system permease protein